MPIPIISERQHVETRTPFLSFDLGGGSGYSYDLTAEGSPVNYPSGTYQSGDDPGAINFVLCCMGWMPGVVGYEFGERVNRYTEPAVGRCHCGREVYLDGDYGHGIDCECGRIFNMSGQELAPRSQWEDRWDEDSTQPYCVEFGYAGDDY